MILLKENLKIIYKCKLRKIIDGDTLDVNVELGFGLFINARIRLTGVNAPEIFKVGKDTKEFERGTQAKYELKFWFNELNINYYLCADERGMYGRWLGEVWKNIGDSSVNDYMKKLGYSAKQNPWYHYRPLLIR